MAKLTDTYTSDSLQSYQNAYNDYMKQGMSSNEALNKAKGLLVEKGTSSGTATRTTPVNSSYQNQGTGNYVYNEKTGYYENQTDTSRNTTNQGLAPRPENVKTETPTKQEEKVVTTDTGIKQEGQLKPLSQDYYNQTSDEAQNKIRANLNGYRQTNPELFSTYEDFKKNFSYDARDEVQKQTLDNWYTGYQKSMELSAIPTNELYTQYKDGTVSLSDLESLRISNPTKYAELQETINKGNIISAYDDDKGADTGMSIQDMAYQSAAQIFTKWMSGDTGSEATQYFRELEAKMESPEMLEIQDKTTELQEQIENLNDDRDRIKKEVEKEYEGTGATRSKINAIIADRSYDLDLQLRTLNSEYNKYATQYNNRMQQYQNEFNMQLQEYQINQDARNQQMKELGFAMDLMNFETNEQKQQREWDYWVKQQEYQNGNINSKDYQTRYKAALNSVNNLLSQYEGIPMVRSAEEMAQDILTAIDNGSNLGAELSKINQQIQKKPEYKYLYNNTYGKGNDISYQTFKLGDKDYIVYNNELMSADEFNSRYGGKATGATGEAKPYDIVDAKSFDTNTMVNKGYPTLGEFLVDPRNALKKNGGWCGAFVNKYLQSIGVGKNYYDNDLSTKLNSVNTKVPQVGSIAVFDYGHITSETGQNHGHVAIVTNVNSDGTFDVIESNFNGDKIIGERKNINPQSSTCKGFFDPSQPPAGSNTANDSVNILSNQDQQKASAILKQIRSGAMTNSDMSSARDWLIENGYGTEFEEALDKGLKLSLSDAQIRVKNDANNTFKTNSIVKEFEESVNQIEQLQTALNDATGIGDMSAIFTFMKTLDPSSVVRESEFNSAAATAGVLNPSAIFQSLERSVDGKFLTPTQREDFKKIAKEFIKTKAQNYNIKYNDLVKDYKNAGIDEQRLPTNMAEVVLKSLNTSNTNQSTLQSTKSSSFTPAWATKYSSSTSYNSYNYVNVEGAEFPSIF